MSGNETLKPEEPTTKPAIPVAPATWRSLLPFALILLATKLLIIAGVGNATPYKDQWGTEGYHLYIPFLNGSPLLPLLFENHYEHHIVPTRLLDIILLEANGQVWNPLLQMTINAVLHTGALYLLLLFLVPACPPASRTLFVLCATLFFCIPFGSENTLWGFQSQIYFVLLFNIVFLHAMSQARSFGTHWWLGIACGELATLSFGSGAATLAAGAGLLFLRWISGIDKGWRPALAMYGVALLALIAVLLTPASPHTLLFPKIISPVASLLQWAGLMPPGSPGATLTPGAESPGEFMIALLSIASWPTLILAPLVYFPLLRFMCQQLRQRPPAGDSSWFLFALALWMIAMMVLIAYGRAKSPLPSRYTDFYAIGLLMNFLCLLRSLAGSPAGEKRRLLLPVLWMVTVGLGLAAELQVQVSGLATVRAPLMQASEQHISDYLRTGDFSYLAINDLPMIPLNPDPDFLKMVLDTSAMHHILPPNLVPENAPRQAGWVVALLANLHSIGMLLLIAGIGLAWKAHANSGKRPADSA